MYQIYALTDPRDGRIFYVGQTSRPLWERHEEHCDINHCLTDIRGMRIEAILSAGLEPSISFLDSADDRKTCIGRELWWIQWLASKGEATENTTGAISNNAALAKRKSARADFEALLAARPGNRANPTFRMGLEFLTGKQRVILASLPMGILGISRDLRVLIDLGLATTTGSLPNMRAMPTIDYTRGLALKRARVKTNFGLPARS